MWEDKEVLHNLGWELLLQKESVIQKLLDKTKQLEHELAKAKSMVWYYQLHTTVPYDIHKEPKIEYVESSTIQLETKVSAELSTSKDGGYHVVCKTMNKLGDKVTFEYKVSLEDLTPEAQISALNFLHKKVLEELGTKLQHIKR